MKKFLPAAGIAAAVMALGACASQSGNSVASNQKAKQKTAKQKMVCFRQTTLGSHIGTTYCVTQQQYAQMQKEQATKRYQTQQQLQQMGSNGQCEGQAGGCPTGGPPN